MTPTTRILLAIAAGAAIIVAACNGGGEGNEFAAPTSTTSETPVVTSTAPPQADLGSGHAVYRLNGDLWLAALDGSQTPRRLTEGAVNGGFAGYVRNDDDTINLYYIKQISEDRRENDDTVSDQVLYRVPLEGGDPEDLLRYTGRALGPFVTVSASVSPNGNFILYSDARGISLLNVASGETRQVLERSPPCTGSENCYSYHRPIWSPDGSRASIAKYFWEGGTDIVIDPLADPVVEMDTPGGSNYAAQWSPDGDRICVSEFTYSQSGAVIVYNPSTNESVDSTLDLPLPTPNSENQLRIDSRGCAWSEDGRLAIAYNRPNDYQTTWIAGVDTDYKLLSLSDPVSDFQLLVGWLPDGSGVVFDRWQSQEGERLQPGVFLLDDGFVDLPFAADEVLGLIP